MQGGVLRVLTIPNYGFAFGILHYVTREFDGFFLLVELAVAASGATGVWASSEYARPPARVAFVRKGDRILHGDTVDGLQDTQTCDALRL